MITLLRITIIKFHNIIINYFLLIIRIDIVLDISYFGMIISFCGVLLRINLDQRS